MLDRLPLSSCVCLVFLPFSDKDQRFYTLQSSTKYLMCSLNTLLWNFPVHQKVLSNSWITIQKYGRQQNELKKHLLLFGPVLQGMKNHRLDSHRVNIIYNRYTLNCVKWAKVRRLKGSGHHSHQNLRTFKCSSYNIRCHLPI